MSWKNVCFEIALCWKEICYDKKRDKTQKPKWWQNLKPQNVIKLKKTQIVTQQNNSNYGQNQRLKKWREKKW